MMKVVVNMACGLANRMFQYCYYLYLRKYGYDAYTDYYTSARLSHEKVSWSTVFPDAELRLPPEGLVSRLGGGDSMLSRIRRRLPFAGSVMEMPSAFDADLPVAYRRDVYVLGVFQNAAMVESLDEDLVRKAFSFGPALEERNSELAQELKTNPGSVAIHVRKGDDYMTRKWYRGTCPYGYYEKAVEAVSSSVETPRFYVFADNPRWVKDNFSWFDYTLVDWNPCAGPGSHFDMQLMSLCSHNIISNSTYSWWAAYLNMNPGKTVIVPDVWFSPESCSEYRSERVLCKGWRAI